jgi:hypothetical protein
MKKDIYKQLMAVSELFGGYAANDLKAAEHSRSAGIEGMDQWLEGRASGYRLVENHCKRMADIYKEEEE